MKKGKLLIYALMAISLIGLVDASYLTATHYLDRDLPCLLTKGCDVVTKSPYSKILNVPIAFFGVLNYMIIFLSALKFLESGSRSAFRILFILSAAAFAFSVWLIYVQAVLLKAFCGYCLISATSAALIFGSVILLKPKSGSGSSV